MVVYAWEDSSMKTPEMTSLTELAGEESAADASGNCSVVIDLSEDQNGFTRPRVGPPVGNGVSLSSGQHFVAYIQLNDQFSCGNDYALKVRKPYTITKQREMDR